MTHRMYVICVIAIAVLCLGYVFMPKHAKSDDRKVIRDVYGKQLGSVTPDPVFKDREIIRDRNGKAEGVVIHGEKRK